MEQGGTETPGNISGRVPALDGLRGVAILLVLAGHTTPLLAGYVGVELFFLLSGYLITGILLRSRGGSGYFRAFYARRALRIWPLYLLFLGVLWTVWPLTAPQRAWLDTNGWWYWLHLANVGHAAAGNPPDHVTTHLWSLAVEEHFYLVWPAVIWWLSPRQARVVCAGLIALGMALRADLNLVSPWANSLIRLDAIALGAWLALPDTRLPRWIGVVSFAALALLLWLEPTLLPKGDPRWVIWLQPILALVFGALLLHVVRRSPRWATWPWLRWLGRVSYCIYLVHMPIAVAVGRQDWGFGLFVVVTTLSCLVAWVSWRFWETPWLTLKDRVPMPVARAGTRLTGQFQTG